MKTFSEFRSNYENMPNISELGEGRFNGTMSGWCFTYNGVNYHTSFGIRGYCGNAWIEIKDGKDRMI